MDAPPEERASFFPDWWCGAAAFGFGRARKTAAAFALLAPFAFGASWQGNQAAVAVIGQASFSASEARLDPVALSISDGQLHVADKAGRVYSYSLNRITARSSTGRCAVCFEDASSAVEQAVPRASAQFASSGKAVAVVDRDNRRVLFWRDVTKPGAAAGPEVVFSGSSLLPNPVSVALSAEYLYVGDSVAHRVLIWKTASVNAGIGPAAVLGDGASSATAMTIADPIALFADGANLFVADGAYHRVLVFKPGDFSFSADNVVATASGSSTALAPGSLITIRGTHLAEGSETAVDDGQTAIPSILAGTELMVNGVAIPLLAVSPEEIRAQVPYGMADASSASLWLRWSSGIRAGRSSTAAGVGLGAVAPALFTLPGTGGVRNGVVLHMPAAGTDVPGSGSPVTSEEPAQPGETLVVWASGLGDVETDDGKQPVAGKPFSGEAAAIKANLEALIDGEPADVLSAVLPQGALGVYEVRLAVPRGARGAHSVTLAIRTDGSLSNTVSFPLNAAGSGSTIHY